MNAPAHFPAHLTETPWSDRIEMAQADEPLAVPLLLSIIAEATREGEPEWAKAAQYALDNGPDEPSRWDDLNALMAEDEQPGEPMNGDYEFYKEVTVEAAASERRKAA